jgi:cell wall-associated NlpC family hydrolase
MVRNLLFIIVISITGCAIIAPPAPVDQPAAIQPPPAPRAERSEALLQTLLALGLDYRYGGSSHATGFDCSGLVAHIYQQAWGIRMPRTSVEQSRRGTPVGLDELQAGDLIFYNTLNRPFSHVGIYVGDGRFVHAPKSGARVRVELVKSAYWMQRFNGARRVEPI